LYERIQKATLSSSSKVTGSCDADKRKKIQTITYFSNAV
jgi:hypothetical protein